MHTLDPDSKKEEIAPSCIGAKYVMVITDDATHYRWVCFLEIRSNQLTPLKAG